MTRLDVQDLAVRVGKRLLIDGLTFDVEPGRFVGLVGPNGSGKSTLLKTIYRVNAIDRGAVLLDGATIDSLSPRAVARQLAVVGQETPNDLEFTVDEIVMLGRLPHQGVLASTSSADHSMVTAALLRTGIAHLGDRRWQTLSGGEKQRVLLARALAQDPQLLLLDEPTNHLDIRHQLALLSLTRSLGTTTVAALHDLDLAAQFCDLVIVLHAGDIVAHGAPADVLVDDVLAPVFGVHVDRIVHPRTGGSRLVFSPMTEDVRTARV